MNGGAYGREVADILVECDVVLRSGELRDAGRWPSSATPIATATLPEGAIVVAATFRGTPGDPAVDRRRDGPHRRRARGIAAAAQPTGGSTFKNPAGAQGLAADRRGRLPRLHRRRRAGVSEKHCNFLLNLGNATSADIEALGEEVRRRVKAKRGVELEWEIQRVGVAVSDCRSFTSRC